MPRINPTFLLDKQGWNRRAGQEEFIFYYMKRYEQAGQNFCLLHEKIRVFLEDR